MEKLIFAIIALLSFSASADVTISKSALNGELTELPSGIFQLVNPTITIGTKNYYLHGDDKTAKVVCRMLGKQYLAEDIEELVATSKVERCVWFNADDSMGVAETAGYAFVDKVAKVITCK